MVTVGGKVYLGWDCNHVFWLYLFQDLVLIGGLFWQWDSVKATCKQGSEFLSHGPEDCQYQCVCGHWLSCQDPYHLGRVKRVYPCFDYAGYIVGSNMVLAQEVVPEVVCGYCVEPYAVSPSEWGLVEVNANLILDELVKLRLVSGILFVLFLRSIFWGALKAQCLPCPPGDRDFH